MERISQAYKQYQEYQKNGVGLQKHCQDSNWALSSGSNQITYDPSVWSTTTTTGNYNYSGLLSSTAGVTITNPSTLCVTTTC